MMKNYSYFLLFIFSGLTLHAQVEKVKTPLNYEDSLSYSIGYDVTRSVKKMDVHINTDWMVQGILDALSDSSSSVISDEQMALIFKELQRRNLEKNEVKMNETSVSNIAAGDRYIKMLMETEKGWKKSNSGLVYKIIKQGNNKNPKNNNTIEVKYTGSLINGEVFDETKNSSTTFRLDQVIAGWTEGMQLIGEGGIIKLVIPAELAYGKNPPSGTSIEPGSALCFIVELIKVGK